ncbi:hypothetical protein [Psychrobacter sp. BF1]|uniref:hypothetical protein n=1 Tax=Psychrobacter sp. BF1 TaxID=2821147 RepID=UPI001C4E28F4|nr:hypothetical protein [Psychrobacter sp. BF1]
MSKYFTLLTPILALVTLNLAACMNAPSMINDVPTTPTLNDGQGKEPYSYNKHFVKGSIKYKNYEELDEKGRTLPRDAIGVVGRFYISEEDNCLIFYSVDSSKVATPILNYKYTQWNLQANVLTMGNTHVKLDQLVLVGGGIQDTPKSYQGSCLNRGYIIDMPSFGVKLLPESDLHLYKQKF